MQEATKIPASDKIIVTVITDNLADALRLDYKIAKRATAGKNPLDMILHAEHGLAYHIETVVEGKAHSCLFDFGQIRGDPAEHGPAETRPAKVEALGTVTIIWTTRRIGRDPQGQET